MKKKRRPKKNSNRGPKTSREIDRDGRNTEEEEEGKKKKIGGREAYLKGAPAVQQTGQWLFAEDSFGGQKQKQREQKQTQRAGSRVFRVSWRNGRVS